MNAKEAREKAESVKGITGQAQLIHIRSLIGSEAAKGEFKCYYSNGEISQENKSLLESEGFKVSRQNDRNEIYYVIEW